MRNNVNFLMLIMFVSSLLGLAGCYGASGGATDNTNKTSSTLSISGTITSNGTALSGVTVTLAGSTSTTATTDGRGNFSFTGFRKGSYTITPLKAGYIFNPVHLPITINGANTTSQNFTAMILLM